MKTLDKLFKVAVIIIALVMLIRAIAVFLLVIAYVDLLEVFTLFFDNMVELAMEQMSNI